MDTMLLAQIFGYYLIIIGISVFLNRGQFGKFTKEFKNQPGMFFLVGALVTLVGLYLTLTHNIWAADWTVLVTIFAWGTLLKGAMIMISPDAFLKLAGAWKSTQLLSIASVASVIVGVFMVYMSYGG